MSDSKHIKFNIVSIIEKEFQYYVPDFLIKTKASIPNNEEKFQVDLRVTYRWNLEKLLFGVEIKLAYSAKHENNIIENILTFSNVTDFYVNDLNEIFTAYDNGKFKIDEDWETTFVGLAISSARGMLASRTAGTFYKDHIFPIVNPKEILVSRKFQQKE